MTFGPYVATVARIHDGDTIDVNILLFPVGKVRAGHDLDLGFNVWRTSRGTEIRGQSVRLAGCNAPEIATVAGKAALAFLETVVAVGDTITVTDQGWDKYGGRIDGTVTLPDGRDLTAVMIASGHAVAWNGQGPKPTP